MDAMDEHLRRQLTETLGGIAEQGIQAVGLDTTVEIFGGFLEELRARAEEKECLFSSESGQDVLVFQYPSASCLARDMDALLEMRGLMIAVDPPPPLMEEITIRIERHGIDESVDLSGRAVHHSPDGAAIELFSASSDQRKALEALVEVSAQHDDTNTTATTVGDERSENRTAAPSPPKPDDGLYPVNRLIDLPDSVERQWNLKHDDINTMLLELARLEGYAVLQIRCPQARRHYVIHYGKLIDVRTDPYEDSEEELIQKLVATGLATASDLERAEALARIHHITRQDALVDIGCITLEELLEAVRQCLIDKMRALWTIAPDRADLYLLSHRPPLRLRRSSVSLAEQVALRTQQKLAGLSSQALEQRKERLTGSRLTCPTQLAIDIEELPFDKQERRFVEVILAEPRTFSDIQRVSHLRGDRLLRFLLLLDELGLLEHREHQQRLYEQSEIEGLVQQVRTKDHFEVLGIHWSAYDEEVENAYQGLLDKLDVPEKTRQIMHDDLQTVRRKIDEAYAVLSQYRSRKAYRDSIIDDFAQRSALQVYEKKLDTQHMRRDTPRLIDSLSRIVELDRSNEQAKRQLEALKKALATES